MSNLRLVFTLILIFTSNIIALKVFSAGSLSIPLRQVVMMYQEKYHENVYLEFSGSVQAIRKIIDLGRCPDLLFVADYSLIPQFMPQDWVVGFASNELVIAYTNDNVGNILRKDWVGALLKLRVGISNPNLDPAGYRALGAIALESFNDSRALILLGKIKGIEVVREAQGIRLLVYPNVRSNDNIIIREKSIDLISLLKAGILDVAFEYKSVAVQHNLKYFELPPSCNLGDPSRASLYSRVNIVLMAGTPKAKLVTLKPIVYGVTIPSCAPNPSKALKFFDFVLSGTGKKIFEKNGQGFLTPMIFIPPKTVK